MKCEGKVLEGGEIARVLMESTACDGCQACGFGAIRDKKKSLEVRALNKYSAEVGDRVYLEVSGKKVMGASAIVFLIPFAGFMTGLLAGFGLGAIFGFSGTPLALALGLVLLASSYYLVYLLGNKTEFEFVITGFSEGAKPSRSNPL